MSAMRIKLNVLSFNNPKSHFFGGGVAAPFGKPCESCCDNISQEKEDGRVGNEEKCT